MKNEKKSIVIEVGCFAINIL